MKYAVTQDLSAAQLSSMVIVETEIRVEIKAVFE